MDLEDLCSENELVLKRKLILCKIARSHRKNILKLSRDILNFNVRNEKSNVILSICVSLYKAEIDHYEYHYIINYSATCHPVEIIGDDNLLNLIDKFVD
jgi:hypothetical protein